MAGESDATSQAEDQPDDGTGSCDATSPEGRACSEGADCQVQCLCEPTNIEAGYCISGECENPDVVCAEVCGDDDYSGQFCSI